MDAPPVLGRDVDGLEPGAVATLDGRSALFPLDSLDRLRPGNYSVQAVLHRNLDLNHANAPGDLYGPARTTRIDPAAGGLVELELTRALPDETVPPDTDLVKHIKMRSQLLSEFHGRPIDLRAGVILPRDFAQHPERRYPLRVHIGGYASRYTGVDHMMADGSRFRRTWMADDAPAMILIHLDGAGPLGDPYQVDSANHGPYGAARHARADPARRAALSRDRHGAGPRARRRLDRRLGLAGVAGVLPRLLQWMLVVLPGRRGLSLASSW